jgi:peptidoglycan/xylan/chitin deacetylase (PgdA/CDA1 family)
MKKLTILRLSAIFFTLFLSPSCVSSLSTDKTSSQPLKSMIELPAENVEETEKTEENRNERIPAPPKSQNALQNGVWDVSDVDVSKISKTKKLIAFSFDDAPSRSLENILAVYADYNEAHPDAPAFCTLFFNGGLFDAQTPKLLAIAHALQFEFGNHTQSHHDLTTLNEAQLRDEIDKTDELLCQIDGKQRHLLRAPFGKINDFVKSVSPTPLIGWRMDTLDWTGVSEDTIYQTVFDNRFSGVIVLVHDGYKHTVDALKGLLPDLYNDGYQVVSISQVAKMHNCTLKQGNVYIRARKQSTTTP